MQCDMKWRDMCKMHEMHEIQFIDFGYMQRDVTLILDLDHNSIILFLISLRIWALELMWDWLNRMSKICVYRLPLLTIHVRSMLLMITTSKTISIFLSFVKMPQSGGVFILLIRTPHSGGALLKSVAFLPYVFSLQS